MAVSGQSLGVDDQGVQGIERPLCPIVCVAPQVQVGALDHGFAGVGQPTFFDGDYLTLWKGGCGFGQARGCLGLSPAST